MPPPVNPQLIYLGATGGGPVDRRWQGMERKREMIFLFRIYYIFFVIIMMIVEVKFILFFNITHTIYIGTFNLNVRNLTRFPASAVHVL